MHKYTTYTFMEFEPSLQPKLSSRVIICDQIVYIYIKTIIRLLTIFLNP
jgi:hypothetical protein